MNSFEAMVQREENAFNRFCDCLFPLGFNRSEVTKIWNTYLKLKVMKVDHVNGTFHVKHGAFMEKDVLTNALERR